MNNQEDLWGEIETDNLPIPPSSILKDQASILAIKTGGKLDGKITTRSSNEGITLNFDIIAPYLNNYSYRVLILNHPVSLYPVSIFSVHDSIMYEARDQSQLVATIRTILQKQSLHDVIRSLIAQSDQVEF